ncbi:MAG: hypothetical protein AB1798_07735, partial [Spirochaetota bacterium]
MEVTDNTSLTDFNVALADVLMQRKEYLEKHELPVLKEQFKVYQTAFQSIYNILLRKGLIQEDQYKHDQKISEISIPAENPFTESERTNQMSIRLSSFDNQLDFLNTYYNFSIEFLSLQRVKLLISLTNYIKWEQLTENSTNINTRVLAELLGKIRQGTDNMSTGLITDALNQISKSSKLIMGGLKDLTSFHREEYKLTFRLEILAKLNLNKNMVLN